MNDKIREEENLEVETKEEAEKSELIEEDTVKSSKSKKIIIMITLSMIFLSVGAYFVYSEAKQEEERQNMANSFEENIEFSLEELQTELITYRDTILDENESVEQDYYGVMNTAIVYYQEGLENVLEIQDNLDLNGSINYLSDQQVQELDNQILEVQELIETYIEETKEEIGQTYLEDLTAMIPEDMGESVSEIEESIETLESIIAMMNDENLESMFLDSDACNDLLEKLESLLEEQNDVLEVAIEEAEKEEQESTTTSTSSDTVNYYGATISSSQANEANAIAQSIANTILSNTSYSTDLEKVYAAAEIVADYCNKATYDYDSNKYYRTPYGVFVAGVYTCAGSTRALGLVLDYMGYSWTHYNENEYSHQWCVLQLDGQTGFADGMGGFAGYGTMYSGMTLPNGTTIFF